MIPYRLHLGAKLAAACAVALLYRSGWRWDLCGIGWRDAVDAGLALRGSAVAEV